MTRILADERRAKLAKLINSEGSYRIGELAERFHVTKETIRKDLVYLDRQKLVTRTHGGAVAIRESIERPLSVRSVENTALKERIARKALEFFEGQKVVILGAGSTVLQLAGLVVPGLCETIITNSLPSASCLSEKEIPFFLVGGEYSPVTMATSGLAATSTIGMISADVAFLGSSGFQSSSGPCSKAFCDAQIKQEFIRASKIKVVLADSSKFTTNSLVRFADWSEIDYLITDDGAPEEMLNELRKKVEVILA